MQVIGKAIGFAAVHEAIEAETTGYDGVRVIDHFFSGVPPEPPVAVPHAFVTLAAAAVVTQRVLLTQTMIAATMRHPFEVAQAVACLDRVSDGRAELGLGAGWLSAEHDGNGLSLGTPGQRVERLIEALQICSRMFANLGQVDFRGTYFIAHSDAAWPATPHVPEIMVGAHGNRLIRGVAATADRIDLLEAMRDGRPNLGGRDANNQHTLSARIALARSVAGEAGREPKFSATVNLQVVSKSEKQFAVARLAEISECDETELGEELLRVIETEDRALQRFQRLRELGVDRVHVRPADPITRGWLDDAVGELHAI
jgi:alkanesulfonate monooxygenase SsuD/methylene tetrahydromethanopterin reductase-like flavin-dependent oxidoreductase (luciferase family)